MFEKAGNHSDFCQTTSVCRICQSNQELFTKVMEILANFTFNFNFFQPDCSVSSPYWYTWLGLLSCRVGAQCRFMKAFSARELFASFQSHTKYQVYRRPICNDASNHILLPGSSLAILSRESRRSTVQSRLGGNESCYPR